MRVVSPIEPCSRVGLTGFPARGAVCLLQGKLGLDRSVRLENLMVSHFLGAMDRLADPSLLQFVKHLQSRAQGEVSLVFSMLVHVFENDACPCLRYL